MLRRRFNTTGPCVETAHYLIDPLSRLPEAPGFIEQGAYFVVHAPRQSGKTTTILALARELTRQGQYAAVYASCQVAADTEDVGQAIGALIHRLGADARQQLPPELHPPARAEAPPIVALMDFLGAWSRACARPVVLLLDEIDALKGAPLLSVLHQLRDGFHHDRPKAFPWSVILCGQQDVTSDRVASSQGRPVSSIPFNIKIASLRLGDFDPHQTDTLLDQHTADTGQVFTPEARAQIFTYTQGQPWLTNALASEIIEEMAVTGPITAEHVERAKENLCAPFGGLHRRDTRCARSERRPERATARGRGVRTEPRTLRALARATHLDALAHTLQEPRVRRILTPLLAGDIVAYSETFDDDLTYVRDLGLVAPRSPLRSTVANPIYREVITRVEHHGEALG
jgi:hypothetical protein